MLETKYLNFEVKIHDIECGIIPEFTQIIIDSWKVAYKEIMSEDFLTKLSPNVIIERYSDRYEKGELRYIGMFGDNTLIGAAIIGRNNLKDYPYADDGEIAAIYLLPDYCHLGLGKCFLNYCEKALIEEGYQHLCLSVFSRNKRAIGFYKKQSYKVVVDELQSDYCEPPERYMIMRKEIKVIIK